MDVTTEAAAGGSDQSSVAIITAEGEGRLSLTDAARTLARARQPKEHQQAEGEQRQEATQQATEESSSALRAPADLSAAARSAEADAAPGESQDPGEKTEGADREAELPPIEPPRSWTKEDKDLFANLPRATQERIAERERLRESDFLRRQNEAVEKLKGLSTKEQVMEQARQQYEAALPTLFAMLQQQQAGDFADIKTLADVERMAREDVGRYARWDVAQRKIADVAQQLVAAHARQAQERQEKFAAFVRAEDEALRAKLPDLADPAKADALQKACLATLTGLGFAETELAQSWQGQKDLSLRDHRVQLLIRDATLWREAQAKAKAAATKPVPPVQRPGTARPAGEAQTQQIENLSKRLETASGVNALRAGADLLKARRAARA
jgi:hypothetical protein